jgi:5,6-dimethylbenzimidazole synthase
MKPNKFPPEQREAVYRAINERRDMRHFLPDAIDSDTLQRLLEAAHAAPSVGYMQPWRFVRITEPALRQSIHKLVSEERLATAQALGEQSEGFMRLKVEGILDCGELLVACLMEKREPHIFGRRTLPDMDLASVSCAIQNIWLGHVEDFYPKPMLEIENWVHKVPLSELLMENHWAPSRE